MTPFILCGLFPHRDLDYSKPFLRVFLVPDAVHIVGPGRIRDFIPHLRNLGKEFDVALTQFGVWAINFHTDGGRVLRQGLEFDNLGVLLRRCNPLAILYLEVFRLVLPGSLDREAISRFRALAAEPGHFGSHDIDQVHSEGIISGKDSPVVSDGD